MGAQQSDERVLADLNRKSFAAEDKGSEGGREELEPILAQDFRMIRSTGVVQDGQGMLAQVAGDESGRRRAIEESDVRVYDNSAVVTSCIVVHEPDGALVGRFWNTKVFAKREAAWRCVAWQVTRIQ